VDTNLLKVLAVLFVLGVLGFVVVPLLVGLVKLLLGVAVILAFVGVGYYVIRR